MACVSHMDTAPYDRHSYRCSSCPQMLNHNLDGTEYGMSLVRIEYLIMEICKLILTNLLVSILFEDRVDHMILINI